MNVYFKIFSVSFSFTQFVDSCDYYFSTSSHKKFGSSKHSLSLILINYAFYAEISAGFNLVVTQHFL